MKYTAIIRKSQLEYVAVCLELNVSARGEDLPDVEKISGKPLNFIWRISEKIRKRLFHLCRGRILSNF